MNNKNILNGVVAIAALTLGVQLSAATFVTATGGSATGAPQNDIYTLFTAVGATSVDSLGVFVPAGFFGDTLTVSLWNSTTLLATTSISSGTPDGTGFVYKPLASSAILTGGVVYGLTVQGYTTAKVGDAGSAPDTAFTVNVGLVSGVFDGTYTGGGNPFGNTTVANFPARYTTASFEASPVPEPETYAMLAGLGLVGFGLYRRCRK